MNEYHQTKKYGVWEHFKTPELQYESDDVADCKKFVADISQARAAEAIEEVEKYIERNLGFQYYVDQEAEEFDIYENEE